MRSRGLVRCLVHAVLVLSSAPGCQALHGSRPVAIEARDAETKKPIPGVDVKISYPLETSVFAPAGAQATAGGDGIARLEAAPFGRAGIMFEVKARGYASEVKYLSIKEVEALEPAHWFEDVQRRPACLIVELFAEPGPTIDLIAPAGFRGQLKAHVKAQADLLAQAGQRSFSYAVPVAGEVVAVGPPIFRKVTSANLRVKFTDGCPISLRAKESALGYWFLKNEGACYHFFVGTPGDFDSYYRSLQSGLGPRQDARTGEGKGRRGQKSMGGPSP